MKKKLYTIAKIVSVAFAAFALYSCSNPFVETTAESIASDSSRSVSAALSGTSDIVSLPLTAGQTIDAGSLTISRDADYLYFKYATNTSYQIGETHLWVGSDIAGLPTNRQGIVVPGQFPYAASYSPAVSTATARVPLSWNDGASVYVFAHASLVGTDSSIPSETAFAGSSVYESNRWTFFAIYEIPALEEPAHTIAGTAFFDVNGNGTLDADEPGIPDVTITATLGSETATATTGADGGYLLEGLSAASYDVISSGIAGLSRTTESPIRVNAANDPANVNFAYTLDDAWIVAQPVNGYTIGFWKTNIDKAIKGTTKGVQVSATTLQSYVSTLSGFALSPLNPANLTDASAILSSRSPAPADLLAKQLLASELNFLNGALFGGSRIATYFFVYAGEYALLHGGEYTDAQLLALKDRYDAYNNTHGGTILAPAP